MAVARKKAGDMAKEAMAKETSTDSVKKKHRITPDVIPAGTDAENLDLTAQEGVGNLTQEHAEKTVGRSNNLEGFGEHWQVEGAQDESEGKQYY
jgi:hypothetical protein